MVMSRGGGLPSTTSYVGANSSRVLDRLGALGTRLLDAALLLAVAFFACLDLQAAAFTSSSVPANPVVSLIALLVVGFRRRRPVGAMVAMVVMILVITTTRGTGVKVFAWDLLLAPLLAHAITVTPVIRRQSERSALAAALTSALVLISLLLWPGQADVALGAVLFGGFTYASAVGLGLYLRDLERRKAMAAEAARLDERLDLARELHDLVAYYVTGIVVRAQGAQATRGDPGAPLVALDQIEAAGRAALTAMRHLVGTLRDAGDAPGATPTAPPPGLGGLHDLADDSAAPGLRVDLSVEPAAHQQVPGAVAASAHRIVQESLTNVHRHAYDATRAEVDLRLRAGALVVTVIDDGHQPVGGRPRRPPGYGLVGMRERAAALGGTLSAGPAAPPHHGWRVRAVLPLDAPPTGAVR